MSPIWNITFKMTSKIIITDGQGGYVQIELNSIPGLV